MDLSNLILLGLLLFIKEVSSLTTPHPLPRQSSFQGGTAYSETAVLNCDTYQVNEPAAMKPLSCPPLLLLQSSTPLISKDACSLLCNYFDDMNDNDYKTTKNLDSNQRRIAEALLDDIHSVIDKVTNCRRHDGENSEPRYVRYESNAIDEDLLLDQTKFGRVLLPDGLHVDTNNGKLFRHITAILYLTDNKDELSDEYGVLRVGGGTSFPLATPIDKKRVYKHNNLQHVAQRLLSGNIEHTKGDAYETPTSDGRTLEMAGLNVFYRDNIRYLSRLKGKRDNQLIATHNTATNNFYGPGVRVMPEAGKLIYFHNVNDKGYPDPISFHGGEELITIQQQENGNNIDRSLIADTISTTTTKSILVFFKEIPVHAFSRNGRDGFAAEAEKKRLWTKQMYY